MDERVHNELDNLRDANYDLKLNNMSDRLISMANEFNYKLDKIIEQTTKTNGSVNRLDSRASVLERENAVLKVKQIDLQNELEKLSKETKALRVISSAPKLISGGVILMLMWLFSQSWFLSIFNN